MATLSENEIKRAIEVCEVAADELGWHKHHFGAGVEVPDGLRERLAAAMLELCNATAEVCATSARVFWQDETLESCLVWKDEPCLVGDAEDETAEPCLVGAGVE